MSVDSNDDSASVSHARSNDTWHRKVWRRLSGVHQGHVSVSSGVQEWFLEVIAL